MSNFPGKGSNGDFEASAPVTLRDVALTRGRVILLVRHPRNGKDFFEWNTSLPAQGRGVVFRTISGDDSFSKRIKNYVAKKPTCFHA